MSKRLWWCIVAALCGLAAAARAQVVRYVDVASLNPQAPYTNQANAAASVGAAAAVCDPGDEVVVAPGRYVLSSAIVITNRIRVRGPQDRSAILDAGGSGACLDVTTNATIEGLTLTGAAQGGAWLRNGAHLLNCLVVSNQGAYGAGVDMAYDCVVENCTIAYNTASDAAGGVIGRDGCSLLRSRVHHNSAATLYGGGVNMTRGRIVACEIYGNQTMDSMSGTGGGVSIGNGLISDCLVYSNLSAGVGGGVVTYGTTTVANCTIAFNESSSQVGGLSVGTDGRCVNSIIMFNTAPDRPNCGHFYDSSLEFSCTTPAVGGGNLAEDPLFDAAGAHFLQLGAASPCRNAGLNSLTQSPTDFLGQPRIAEVFVDMGAIEYQVALWSAALDIGGGWNWSSWFGYFHCPSRDRGWLWHAQHAYLYAGGAANSLWLYDPAAGMGWLWTSATTYPYLYRLADSAWLYYQVDTPVSPGRWFYNLGTTQWEQR